MSDYDPSWTDLREDGSWDTVCPRCRRIVILYDLKYASRQLPRGPAPTQAQREQGWDDEMAYTVWN